MDKEKERVRVAKETEKEAGDRIHAVQHGEGSERRRERRKKKKIPGSVLEVRQSWAQTSGVHLGSE